MKSFMFSAVRNFVYWSFKTVYFILKNRDRERGMTVICQIMISEYLRKKITINLWTVSRCTFLQTALVTPPLDSPLALSFAADHYSCLYPISVSEFCVHSSSYPIAFPLLFPCFLSSLCRMFSSQFPRNCILSPLYASVCFSSLFHFSCTYYSSTLIDYLLSFLQYFLYFHSTCLPHFFSLSDGESWPLYVKRQPRIRSCSLKKTPISKCSLQTTVLFLCSTFASKQCNTEQGFPVHVSPSKYQWWGNIFCDTELTNLVKCD